MTSVEDREEEKKYCLRHRWFNFDDRYLNKNLETNQFFLSYAPFENYKSAFTLKEIEEIKEKYCTTLEDFEIIEVLQ